MTGTRGWLERLAHPVLGLVSQEAEPGEKDCGGGAADASSVAVPEPEASGGGFKNSFPSSSTSSSSDPETRQNKQAQSLNKGVQRVSFCASLSGG